MLTMERRLNSRAAKRTAWAIVGLMLAGVAGFAAFLVWPVLTGSGAVEDELFLDGAPLAAVTPAVTPGGRGLFTGTVQRIEGQALVLSSERLGQVRVLIRRGAPTGQVVFSSASDLRPGEDAVVIRNRQDDGRLLGVSVRLQPPELPMTGFNGSLRVPPTSGPADLVGKITAVEGRLLRLATAQGEQTVDLSPNVRVSRFALLPLTEVRVGQRLVIDGERLVDGSLSAYSVQVFEAR